MKNILIVKTGGTFGHYAESHGDFEHWTAKGMGLAPGRWECVNVQDGERLPNPDDFAGCVITGSHDMVTDDSAWMRETATWIQQAVDAGLPVLGICFGHQILAVALGGEAGNHPNGLEMGTVGITLTDEGREDLLLGHLPPGFKANMAHSQTVLKLPEHAVLLAKGAHEAHQSYRVGDHAWGVQFHPEFNADAIRIYLDDQREKTKREEETRALLFPVEETPESATILERFAAYCRNR